MIAIITKRTAVIAFAGCCLANSSAWAIECQSAAGDPKTGWYSWREIDGRKCWFKKTGAMPPKSQLHWPAESKPAARAAEPPPPAKERAAVRAAPPARERTELAAVTPPASEKDERPAEAPAMIVPPQARERTQPVTAAPPPDTASKPQPAEGSSLRFRTARVKPAAAPFLRMNGFDLMNSADLSTLRPLGEPRPKHPSPAPAASFSDRFNPQR